jgi:hypothetical protein
MVAAQVWARSNQNGSFLLEEYTAYGYGTRRIYPGSGSWPSNFIDF